MRDLVRASFVTWIGAGSVMLASLIRGKVLAVELGPSGVGILSQLTGFSSLVGIAGSLSLGNGIAQFIARYVGERTGDDVRRIAQTSVVITGLVGFFLSIVVWIAAHRISELLFNGDISQKDSIRVMALGIVAMSLTLNLQAVLNGHGAAAISSLTDVMTAIATIGFTLLLVGLMGFSGAVLSIVFIQFARLIVQLTGLHWKYPDVLKGMPRFLDWTSLRTFLTALLRIAGASAIMSLSDSSAQLFVRSQIIRLYGAEANGLYQAAFGASSQVLVVSMGFVSSYAFALVNSASTSEERSNYTNQAFQLALLVLVSGASGLILFRDIYIHLLLSSNFLQSGGYFASQALGETFKQMGLVIGLAVLLTSGVRVWMGIGLFWALSNIFLSLIILPIGVWTLPLPYLLSSIIYFSLSWYVMARNDRFKMMKRNIYTLFSAIILLLLLAISDLTWVTSLLGLSSFFIWFWYALGNYRSAIWALAYKHINFLTMVI
jgi:O-antigen/teichoic acid export membrane protein